VPSNDLFDFLKAQTAAIAAEYERIRKRAAEDPGTAGDQGEENWATLLREWLPPSFQIVTKGRILGIDGVASPQVDVVILSPAYPTFLLDKKLYLAAGVLAAFECKITLTASHIRDAVQNSVLIKSLGQKEEATPYKELHSPILYGLLAHSHSWKGEDSRPNDNVNNSLNQSDLQFVRHPRETLDLICVADLATWVVMKVTFFGPSFSPWSPEMANTYGPRGSATTSYLRSAIGGPRQTPDFTPIGAMLGALTNQLAWGTPMLRNLADYYRMANMLGSGEGAMRFWNSSIYSDAIRGRVEAGQLTSGARWDEWSIAFM
jgi:hypothetical protein